MVGGYQKGMSNCQEWIGLKTCRVELCKKDLLHESAQEVLFGFGSPFVQCFVFLIAAVEIHGHEETIFVGLVGEIYCSTHLNVTQIEWFHVGVNDSLREKSYGSKNLVLTINATNTELNSAIFTCRVTDMEWKQYEESVSIRVKGDFVFLTAMKCGNN